MIDRSLMYRVLTVLGSVDRTGMRETILLDEIAIESSRHLEASEIREHLADALRHGWVEKYKGTLNEPRWRILEEGRAAMRDLKN